MDYTILLTIICVYIVSSWKYKTPNKMIYYLKHYTVRAKCYTRSHRCDYHLRNDMFDKKATKGIEFPLFETASFTQNAPASEYPV